MARWENPPGVLRGVQNSGTILEPRERQLHDEDLSGGFDREYQIDQPSLNAASVLSKILTEGEKDERLMPSIDRSQHIRTPIECNLAGTVASAKICVGAHRE